MSLQKENGPVPAGPSPKISATHDSTPVNNSPLPTAAAQPATLLTVEDFQAWQRVNAAAHAEAEAHAQATMVDAVLRDVLMHMSWGLQAACDHAWSTRGKHAPSIHRQAVREALEAIGWVREEPGVTD